MKIFIFTIFFLTSYSIVCQNDVVPPKPDVSCESGTEQAIKDAQLGKYKLLKLGLQVYKDWYFEVYYHKYLKTKYGILVIDGGCTVFPSKNCYAKTMRKLIYKKFGDDIFDKAREEAKLVYNKNQ